METQDRIFDMCQGQALLPLPRRGYYVAISPVLCSPWACIQPWGAIKQHLQFGRSFFIAPCQYRVIRFMEHVIVDPCQLLGPFLLFPDMAEGHWVLP